MLQRKSGARADLPFEAFGDFQNKPCWNRQTRTGRKRQRSIFRHGGAQVQTRRARRFVSWQRKVLCM